MATFTKFQPGQFSWVDLMSADIAESIVTSAEPHGMGLPSTAIVRLQKRQIS